MKRFTRSSYWGSWSRVLSDRHPQGPFVEVNLTPIPCCGSSTWKEDVAPVRIRLHGTARDRRDVLTDVLPDTVRAAMVQHLGEEMTERLLMEDFLPQIDWDLYRKFNNGGANLEDIRRKQS